MGNIEPKFRNYIFLTMINMLLALAFNITRDVFSNDLNLMGYVAGIGGSFIPFISTISVIITGIGNAPTEVIALFSAVTGIISGIMTYWIAEIILNHLPLVDI